MKETNKKNTKKTESKKVAPKTTKTVKKTLSPDNAHWVKSQAKLMKILEAAGMAPEHHKAMITCHHDR